jgi:flagellar L-ring protein FlgH
MTPFLLAVVLAPHAAPVLTQDPLPAKVNPGSLYGPTSGSIFADRTARAKGDILTVVIDESSLASYAAKTKASKADNSGVNFKLFSGFLDSLFKPILNGISSNSSNEGAGETTHTGRMQFRMSAVVKTVMPNGALVIEGSRTLVTNKETQTFVLSGVVRPIDVASDNTVRSAQIADAEIKMAGKGMIQDRQRKGILTQLMDWLF